MLVRLLHASRAAAPLTAPGRRIHPRPVARAQSPPRHHRHPLLPAKTCFLQVLEGGRDEVCELYNTIVRDDRHTNVRILTYEEIPSAASATGRWSHVDIATVNPSLS